MDESVGGFVGGGSRKDVYEGAVLSRNVKLSVGM